MLTNYYLIIDTIDKIKNDSIKFTKYKDFAEISTAIKLYTKIDRKKKNIHYFETSHKL